MDQNQIEFDGFRMTSTELLMKISLLKKGTKHLSSLSTINRYMIPHGKWGCFWETSPKTLHSLPKSSNAKIQDLFLSLMTSSSIIFSVDIFFLIGKYMH